MFVVENLRKVLYQNTRSGNHSRIKKAEKKFMIEQMRVQAKLAKSNGLMNPMSTTPLATS